MYYAWGWEITARLLKPFNADWSLYMPLGTTLKIYSLPTYGIEKIRVILKRGAIISLRSINCLVFVIERVCVYCAVPFELIFLPFSY